MLWRVVLLFVIGIPGCVTLERSYPDKRYFVIEIRDPAKSSATQSGQVLLVSTLHVSPRYSGTGFVYRTSETGFETDFYNQFLSSPATMISEEVRKGLASAAEFKYIIGPSSQLLPNYNLEGSVNALYGDFRNLQSPAAVLEIEFFLRNEDPAKAGVVLHKRYLKTVPIDQRSPDALTRGWNEALEAIVATLVADTNRIKP